MRVRSGECGVRNVEEGGRDGRPTLCGGRDGRPTLCGGRDGRPTLCGGRDGRPTLWWPGRPRYSRGSQTVKVLPCPRPALAASTRPPWSSARPLTIVNPRPNPLRMALVERASLQLGGGIPLRRRIDRIDVAIHELAIQDRRPNRQPIIQLGGVRPLRGPGHLLPGQRAPAVASFSCAIKSRSHPGARKATSASSGIPARTA